MRLVHFSDCHLSYRQYHRLSPLGINQREVDVSRTFHTLIDRVIAIAPDVVVIAGDTFHSPRPSNSSLVHASTEFCRLIDALPETPVILIGGNHCTPKTSETGCVLPLFAPLGVTVVDRGAQRLYFPKLDLSVLCVPDSPGIVRPEMTPDPRATHNVLLLHGEVDGMVQDGRYAGKNQLSHAELGVDAWDYIALGHYHVYREITPNCFYSGSIDYTSTDTWGEVREEEKSGLRGKGFIERDLDTGEHTFHELPPSRPLFDLPPIEAHGMGAAELDEAIKAAMDSREIDNAIVRLIVTNVSREVSHALDQKALRGYRNRALGLNLDLRRPERIASAFERAVLPRTQRKTLEEEVRHTFAKRDVPNDVNREAFVAGGLHYLEIATTDADREKYQATAQRIIDTVRDPYLENIETPDAAKPKLAKAVAA